MMLLGAESGADISQLVQYGVLGVLVVAFIFGQVVPGYLYKQVVRERDQKDAELSGLRTKIEEQIVPQMVRTSEVLARALDKEKHG